MYGKTQRVTVWWLRQLSWAQIQIGPARRRTTLCDFPAYVRRMERKGRSSWPEIGAGSVDSKPDNDALRIRSVRHVRAEILSSDAACLCPNSASRNDSFSRAAFALESAT